MKFHVCSPGSRPDDHAAAIENARRIRNIRDEYGGLSLWLGAHHPLGRDEWTRLFRQTFVFMGGEIVNEFLMSTGWLPGAHVPDCPVHARTIAAGAPWTWNVTRFITTEV